MAINKVVYGDDTLIDLTNTTATADRIVSGTGAYGADGVWMDGTLTEVFPSDDNPAMDGTASPGVSINYSRADHVHPHDSSIPTKTSDLTNDSGFITGITSADVTTALGYTPPMQDTTYESKTAASGGTDVSLVTTGEKYTWNNKGTYSKPSGGIPASDLASGVIPTVPTAYISNPAMDGAASPGNSGSWARGDHVHPTDTSRASAAVLATYVRPNLLDNWYFVGGGSQLAYGKFPINQRGQTTYSGAGYHIDRWVNYNITRVDVNTDGVTLVSSNTGFAAIQYIANPTSFAGKTLTATALYSSVSGGTAGVRIGVNGAAYSGTDLTAGGLTTVTHKVTASEASSISLNIRLSQGTTAKLVAVKLEIGDSQTLAHQENGEWVLNEIPDYETELLRCKTSTADPSDNYANGSVEFGSNIGIIQNTNTATQDIPKDRYVIWHGALYTASAAIASGAALSSSNLKTASGGGLNDVGEKVSVLRNDTALIITTRRWNDSPFVDQVVSLEGGLYLMTIDSRNMGNSNYTGVYIVEINTTYNSHITTLKAPVTPIANASVNKGTLTITPVSNYGFASIVKLTN